MSHNNFALHGMSIASAMLWMSSPRTDEFIMSYAIVRMLEEGICIEPLTPREADSFDHLVSRLGVTPSLQHLVRIWSGQF